MASSVPIDTDTRMSAFEWTKNFQRRPRRSTSLPLAVALQRLLRQRRPARPEEPFPEPPQRIELRGGRRREPARQLLVPAGDGATGLRVARRERDEGAYHLAHDGRRHVATDDEREVRHRLRALE